MSRWGRDFRTWTQNAVFPAGDLIDQIMDWLTNIRSPGGTISVNYWDDGINIDTTGATFADEGVVRVSASDETVDHLWNKLTTSDGVTATIVDPRAEETMDIRLDFNGLSDGAVSFSATGDPLAYYDKSASTHMRSDLDGMMRRFPGYNGSHTQFFMNLSGDLQWVTASQCAT